MGQWTRKSVDELQGFSECTDWDVFVADICELFDRLTVDRSVGRASDLKARRNAEASSSPRCGKRFLPRVNILCRLFYGVPAAPWCSRVHPHTPVKNPKHLQSYHCLSLSYRENYENIFKESTKS